MYTATKLGDTFDKQALRRIITMRFEDAAAKTSFDKDFSFNPTATLEEIKRTIKGYLDGINYVPPVVADGVIDLTETPVTPSTKTPEQIAREEWEKDRARLANLMELVRDKVFTGTETAIVNLQAKVKADFKAEYLD